MSGPHNSWHGIPPSRDRFTPPIQQQQPPEGVHWTTEKAPPVWVELTYENGSTQTVKGFAMAWTRELIMVQWVEFSMGREAWVEASVCRRREIPQRAAHRDG